MKKIIQITKSFAWPFIQLFVAAPFEALPLLFFVLLQALIPAISLYAIQGIIEWVNSTSDFPIFFVAIWGGMLLTDIVLSPIISIVRLHLNEKLLAHYNILLMEKANAIQGLDLFENSKFYDEIQFLKSESSKRPLNFVYVLTGLMKEMIALFSVLFVLISLGWWVPMGMFIASLPHAVSTLWLEKQSWDQMLFRSPEARKLSWLFSLTLDEHTAKEIRLFGFGSFLVESYKKLAKAMHERLSSERWKKSVFSIFLSSLTVVGNIVIISLILLQAKAGFVKIGSLVIAIQALVMTQSQLSGCISYLGMITPILLFFKKLKIFLASSNCSISQNKSNFSSNSFHEIQFNNVSFSYPDGRKALSNVNFVIKQGEKIAVVGENGAGKSTLVKLLLRFYDPTEGFITVDGKNLKTLDLENWRSKISGVFQDFCHYHFTVSENISLGGKANENTISLAAQKGGFDSVLPKLTNGFQSYLGKEFGGTSLSGGEWQKLAMSRGFHRESADLLILDEPTSALDPESEQEVFKKFSEATQEKTALLITHRLGSVKMADRILVFKKGELIEEGSHANLIKNEGAYASLFAMQAEQYTIK